jgi:hypothetical protein
MVGIGASNTHVKLRVSAQVASNANVGCKQIISPDVIAHGVHDPRVAG